MTRRAAPALSRNTCALPLSQRNAGTAPGLAGSGRMMRKITSYGASSAKAACRAAMVGARSSVTRAFAQVSKVIGPPTNGSMPKSVYCCGDHTTWPVCTSQSQVPMLAASCAIRNRASAWWVASSEPARPGPVCNARAMECPVKFPWARQSFAPAAMAASKLCRLSWATSTMICLSRPPSRARRTMSSPSPSGIDCAMNATSWASCAMRSTASAAADTCSIEWKFSPACTSSAMKVSTLASGRSMSRMRIPTMAPIKTTKIRAGRSQRRSVDFGSRGGRVCGCVPTC